MAKFKFIISRFVTTSEWVEREVEAESEEAAQALADEMAASFDGDCPDDYQPGDYLSCDDWEAELEEADD